MTLGIRQGGEDVLRVPVRYMESHYMTPALELTGYLPVAVSAVHALGTLVRLFWERSPSGGRLRPANEGDQDPQGCGGPCRGAAHVAAVVRLEVAAQPPVSVRIAVGADPCVDDAAAGGVPGPIVIA
ncbi:hypothetical protein HEK616_84360 (plasmid) [Streptomyces nigrescens]|uniref:Uncharacterized protein n=1 Tax=Streptomyces nigrescens TaxID=1920 RepID=A0ABN6R9A1_STRNI|nr:hypothetical protein HEK616_84360 [Streptomyces nigrescens]